MSEKTSDTQTRKKPAVGTPCWIEIPAADVPACREFYSRLFPSWDFRPATKECPGDEMAMWSFAGPSGLTGGIRRVAAECKTSEQKNGVGGTVFYFVESIENIQKQTEELGGAVCSAKEAEDDNGWYMYLKDVAGNRFGIYQLQK